MQLSFQKIHGAGNDFVVFDNRQGSVLLSEEQVRWICDRHCGVGADGVIEVRTSPRPECVAFMHYRNADGSLAEMCGNGVRCFVRYLADNGLLSPEEMAARSCIVDTLAGPRPLRFELDEDDRLSTATVEMGEPVFAPELIPTTLPATREIVVAQGEQEQTVAQAVVKIDAGNNETANNGRKMYPLTCVNMGNPHAVLFLDDIDDSMAQDFVLDPQSFDLESVGASLEGDTHLFPQKTNVEVAAVYGSATKSSVVNGPNRIRMRVYERGVGETLACGTGACAVAVAAIALGKVDGEAPVQLELPGGTLTVEWLPTNQVTLTGPVDTVFCGTLSLDALNSPASLDSSVPPDPPESPVFSAPPEPLQPL
ncbi:MAG: diaminopimelate epimerase [Coriobacteriales bacterium]|jgi:diaminopimelate epimerase|nr:diaminopimelate epimerase [Coriobacteriales bacterium]